MGKTVVIKNQNDINIDYFKQQQQNWYQSRVSFSLVRIMFQVCSNRFRRFSVPLLAVRKKHKTKASKAVNFFPEIVNIDFDFRLQCNHFPHYNNQKTYKALCDKRVNMLDIRSTQKGT